MGRASSKKKAARAARPAPPVRTGRPNWLWPAALVVVIALGVVAVITSRGTADADDTPPVLFEHWHAAYGINVCGEWLPALSDQQGDRYGIHTHEDGLIHIHPSSNAATGERATLDVFFEEVGLTVEEDELEVPGRQTLENGDDCNGEPGRVVVKVWENPVDEEGRVLEGDPGDYRPQNGNVIAFGFLPDGEELEKPPTVARLQDPTAPEEGRPLVPLQEGADAATTTTSAPAADATTTTSAP